MKKILFILCLGMISTIMHAQKFENLAQTPQMG